METHRYNITTSPCCALLLLLRYVIRLVRPCVQPQSAYRCGNDLGTRLRQYLGIETAL